MSPLELAAATGFRGALVCEYVDGTNWIVREAFQFCSSNPAIGCIAIDDGFQTDFASIPRFFWRILSPTDRHIGKAAVIHDWIYRTPGVLVTRAEADAVLLEGMRLLGAPWWKRQAVKVAVRIGGRRAYKPRLTL